jgi:hypothetical protein
MDTAEFITLTDPSDLGWFLHPYHDGLLPEFLQAEDEDGRLRVGKLVGYSADPVGLFIVWGDG